MGPSGGGKTFSALRLATGIQSVTGGDIYGIDTEARRMLHYADTFKFKHMQFDPPFGSLDYLAAIRQCVKSGAGVIIIDSMSHEHDGVGGLLDTHESELDRLAGEDYQKRERMKFLAWQKPKAARRELINGITQLNASFIFCFRAKNSLRPVKNQAGKVEMIPQGFLPISGEELIFEMIVNLLLLPKAGGIPTWQSNHMGEKAMIKEAHQFKRLFHEARPLDEAHGKFLAEWVNGKVTVPLSPDGGTESVGAGTVTGPAPAGAASKREGTIPEERATNFDSAKTTERATHSESTRIGEPDMRLSDIELDAQIDLYLIQAADKGTATLQTAWKNLEPVDQKRHKSALDRRHKPLAAERDKALREESTESKERAEPEEGTISSERADGLESATHEERAGQADSNTQRERAAKRESAIPPEQPDG